MCYPYRNTILKLTFSTRVNQFPWKELNLKRREMFMSNSTQLFIHDPHISSKFLSDYEALASELLGNLKEIFPL